MNRKFKLICPTGYQVSDHLNDNLDINLVMRSGEVYSCTLFTLKNIDELMSKDNDLYFHSRDMLIVKSLDKDSIRHIFCQIVIRQYETYMLPKIGNIKTIYGNVAFEDLEDSLSEALGTT